jgi:type III secretion protein L
MSSRHAPRFVDPEGALDRPFGDRGEANAVAGIDEVGLERDRALERGYREGIERAHREMAEERERSRKLCDAAVERIARLEQSLTERYEAALLDVTIEAASRIVRERIERGDPIAARALREALESSPTMGKLRARLHPDDLEGARALFVDDVEAGSIELVADPRIERGGTSVETPLGTLDARLPVAIEAVHAAVVGTEPGS